MRLLNAYQDQEDKEFIFVKKQVDVYKKALNSLIAETNKAKDEIDSKKKALSDDLANFKADCEHVKATLKAELSELEEKAKKVSVSADAKALKMAKKEAESLNKQLHATISICEQERADLDKSRASMASLVQEIESDRADLDEKESCLSLKQSELALKEKELSEKEAQQTIEIYAQWDILHQEKAKIDAIAHQAAIDKASAASDLEIIRSERKKLEDDRRAIKDGYESLERARKEILGRVE